VARIWAPVAVLILLFITPCLHASDCIPFQEGQHVGEIKCVTGKVLRIKLGAKGVHFLDFCEDQMACPFTVVVFASRRKDVGDDRPWKAVASRFTEPSNSTTDEPRSSSTASARLLGVRP
jgi:hypothetical protein